MNRDRELKLRESKRKLDEYRVCKLNHLRNQRNELNNLMNKELKLRNGANNLYSVSKDRDTQEKLKLDMTFMDSKIKYLKDQLSELSTDWSVFGSHEYKNSISSDIMIYLPLKETQAQIEFFEGLNDFIRKNFKDLRDYTQEIQSFVTYREATLRQTLVPDYKSISCLFEYFNSLTLIEKRFFRFSQCDRIHFTWYDSINGEQSTQKSIQLEKASILFNCAALYTQIAAIRQNGHTQMLTDQQQIWQLAAGCLQYLNTNFSNSPSFDMKNALLEVFIEICMCQAYEIQAKILNHDLHDDLFINLLNLAKIYSHISERYSNVINKIETNTSLMIKHYLPEIWFHLIKVKDVHFKALAHYYAALAISSETNSYGDVQLRELFESLHDNSHKILKPCAENIKELTLRKSKKSFKHEYQWCYDLGILKTSNRRYQLVSSHLKESLKYQEEALRQHSFCRKFSKSDYLYELLYGYKNKISEKMYEFDYLNEGESESAYLIQALPINSCLSNHFILEAIEPNLKQYKLKDFFISLGPLKIYSCEFELSTPYTCILKKSDVQLTYGLTLKGDSPVRVECIDAKSAAHNAGIRVGDYIIGIHDTDVRWLKHTQIIEKIRSCSNYLKLTLVKANPISDYLATSYTKEILAKQENNEISGFNTSRLRKKLEKWSLLCSTTNIRDIQANLERLRSIKLSFNTLTISSKLKKSAMKLSVISYFNRAQSNNNTNINKEIFKVDDLLCETL